MHERLDGSSTHGAVATKVVRTEPRVDSDFMPRTRQYAREFYDRQEMYRGETWRDITIPFSKYDQFRGISPDGKYEVTSTLSGDYKIRETSKPHRSVIIDKIYVKEGLEEIGMKLIDLKNAQGTPKREVDLTLLEAQTAQLLTDFDDDIDMDD